MPAASRVRRQEGELVCTRPFPEHARRVLGRPGRRRVTGPRISIVFPGVWRHGDWARTDGARRAGHPGPERRDPQPGGVRIGTAEIYRQVEQLPEVVESLVVGQDWEGDVRIVLFVRLREGATLDEALEDRIRRRIREHASPHHVPRKILQVADIPRTISGKITELAVRDVIHGRPVSQTGCAGQPGRPWTCSGTWRSSGM